MPCLGRITVTGTGGAASGLLDLTMALTGISFHDLDRSKTQISTLPASAKRGTNIDKMGQGLVPNAGGAEAASVSTAGATTVAAGAVGQGVGVNAGTGVGDGRGMGVA